MPLLSERGKLSTKPAMTYLPEFWRALESLYDKELNPEGHICFTIAENKISFKQLLADKLLEIQRETTLDDFEGFNFPPFYGNATGLKPFKESIAKYMSKYFLANKFQLEWEKVVVATGVTSLVDNLSWIIADAGDSFILTAPYYPAFDNDLKLRSKITPVPAFLEQGSDKKFKLTEACLNEAYEKSNGTAKAILLTNPDNPLGICHPKEDLKMALRWAREKGLYIISDEIYAMAVHSGDDGSEFISMMEICLEESNDESIGDDVIILYGFSKDFCLSGARVGILYTENKEIIKASGNIGCFSQVSTFTQSMLSKLLNDEEFISNYLEDSRTILKDQCDLVKKTLSEAGIPFIKSTAAMFLVADFRSIIKTRYNIENVEFGDERKFFKELANEAKILVTPGQDCHFQEAGFYRICYSFSDRNSIVEFSKRLARFLDN